MIEYTSEVIRMIRGGYRPKSHGEWMDTHYGNTLEHIFGAALCAHSMASNQRFVVVEL